MLDMTVAGAELAAIAAPAGVQEYSTPPDKPEVPAVFPEEWSADFTEEGTPVGDGGFYEVSMTLLVSRSDDSEARRSRNTLVKTMVDNLYVAQPTKFSDLIVTSVDAPADLRDFGGVAYVHATITVRLFG